MTKDDLNDLKIEWDLDFKNYQFEKLRGYPENLLHKTFSVEVHKLETLNKVLYPNFLEHPDNEIINLIEFVRAGNKVIPPAFLRIPKILIGTRINGAEIFQIYTKPDLSVQDGCHRVSLAKNIGLDNIPILVYEFDEDFSYHLVNYIYRVGIQIEQVQ